MDFLEKLATVSLAEVFEAYYECRKHKRKTANALRFEMNFEHNLVQLWREINNRTYKIGRSLTFIVRKPVLREIFAADFRDRIVHHLVMRKLMPLFEAEFSPHSYSCRKGKGTLYGIREVYQHVKDCSCNYTKDCYVMKLDVQGFFMSINQKILYENIKKMICARYRFADKSLILHLVRLIVFNRPQDKCIRRGCLSNWDNLPRHKSLFFAPPFTGLPIGNLTSQIFANFYLNDLDRLVAREKSHIYYGRYVDDFVMIHPCREKLMNMRKKIAAFLQKRLFLNLHPFKIYLQHYVHGFNFIGVFMRPRRIYVGTRMKTYFYQKIVAFNRLARPMSVLKLKRLESIINSYYGFMRHCASARLRYYCWALIDTPVRRLFWSQCRFLKVALWALIRIG